MTGDADTHDTEGDDFDRAVTGLLAAIKDSAHSIKSSPFYGDERNRAGGLEHLIRTIYQAIDRKFWQDPDFPLFRKLDFRAGYGGDSPDQQYLQAFIRGGQTYRIWGTLRTQRLVDIRLYAGLPWAGGRVVAHLNSHDFKMGENRSIEIIASPTRVPGNWLENPPGGTEILVREIFGNWIEDLPGDLHIDRVEHEGDIKPAASLHAHAARVDELSNWLRFGVRSFQELVMREMLPLPVNTIGAPKTMAEWQGIAQRARAYAFGRFDLGPDDVLIVTMRPVPVCEYLGVVVNNLWYFTPEYVNAQPSLNDQQAVRTADGLFHFVVAATDPGAANWLDTTGLVHGILMFRYDGLPATGIAKEYWPIARKVRLADVQRELPRDTCYVSAKERAGAIRLRRQGIQLRNVQ